MKKYALFHSVTILFALFIISEANAQWTASGANTFTNPLSNKVGIGVSTPTGLLDVFTSSAPGPNIRITNPVNMGTGALEFALNNCGSPCYALNATTGDGIIRNYTTSNQPGVDLILSAYSPMGSAIRFTTCAQAGTATERMTLLPNGQVLIGFGNNPTCTLPTPGMLGVNGAIYATSVKVRSLNSSSCFPDYVFEKEYKLMPLSEVEQYINKNKHLPEIPSAKEVEKNGIDMEEMDTQLLKKIEELTLYMIEMKKESQVLKTELQKENEALKRQVEALNKKISN